MASHCTILGSLVNFLHTNVTVCGAEAIHLYALHVVLSHKLTLGFSWKLKPAREPINSHLQHVLSNWLHDTAGVGNGLQLSALRHVWRIANKSLETFKSSHLPTANPVHLNDFFQSTGSLSVCLVPQSCGNNPYSLPSSLKLSNNHAGEFVQYTFLNLLCLEKLFLSQWLHTIPQFNVT